MVCLRHCAEAKAAEERAALMDGVAALVGQFVARQEHTARGAAAAVVSVGRASFTPNPHKP
jgi:hypothetical protein